MEQPEEKEEADTAAASDNYMTITEFVSPLQKQLLKHVIHLANTPADTQDPAGAERDVRKLRLLENLVEAEKARNPNYAVSRLVDPNEKYVGLGEEGIDSEEERQFSSCFISYSHKDEEFAQRLYGRMRQEGLRVWYAPEEMKGGEKLHEQINEAIQFHDRLLLVLSENSLGSEWVKTEIRRARKAEQRESRRKLFPIRLLAFDPAIKDWECFDADTGKDLGVEIREYFIPDFSDWKEQDAFEAGFARLLRDLKAEERAA